MGEGGLGRAGLGLGLPARACQCLGGQARAQPMPALAASWSSLWPLGAGCTLGLRHLELYAVGGPFQSHRQGDKPPPGLWLLAGAWRCTEAVGALGNQNISQLHPFNFWWPGEEQGQSLALSKGPSLTSGPGPSQAWARNRLLGQKS